MGLGVSTSAVRPDPLKELDELEQGGVRAEREVDRLGVRHSPLDRVEEHPAHRADVREVTRVRAVAVHRERLPPQQGVDEDRDDCGVYVTGALAGP